MEEAQELLEQMELEVREVDAASRPRLRTHVDSYRAELGRLSQEFLKVRSPPFQDGRATHPLYCLDRSTVHVLEAVRDELTSIHSSKENSCLYWLA
uniref:Vesicle transport v-SNARE N-terminal domain-containing protein n=1 Tax=Timema tahoe TaxID=61484 RepID=A0A7R9IMU8_9NEOP|nr:unnamed protein product [Timema tahoe]